MNYDFLESFQPHIIDVADRKQKFWDNHNYIMHRKETRMHSLALVYEGEGSLIVNGSRYALSTGVLFYIPQGSFMEVTTKEINTVKYYSVLFHYGQLKWESAGAQCNHEMRGPLLQRNVMFFAEMPALLELYQQMVRVWDSKEGGYRWNTKLEFLRLLDLIMHMIREDSQYMQRNAALIESAIAYIREHLSEDFGRSAIAARFSISPGYFSSLFKQHTGCTPVEFVTQLRMDRAKNLLRVTSLTISQIAAELGYADSFYFTRLFRKDTGLSPREFRKS